MCPETPRFDRDSEQGTLCVPAQPAYLALVGDMVRRLGLRAGLSDEQCHDLEVAVDEACTNVVRYAFPEQAAGEMTVICSPSDRGLEVSIIDRGKPFDPRNGVEVARDKRERDPSLGGMGLLLIHQLTDEVSYRWDEQEGNRLTLLKHR